MSKNWLLVQFLFSDTRAPIGGKGGAYLSPWLLSLCVVRENGLSAFSPIRQVMDWES